MRFLLLFLSILWSVHSFKQYKIVVQDVQRCKTDHYCLVAPEIAGQQSNDDYLVPIADQIHSQLLPSIGIFIKPLSSNKWVLTFYGEKTINAHFGMYLSIIKRGTFANMAITKRQENIVAGCFVEDNTDILKTVQGPSVKYYLRSEESTFIEYGKFECVGILTSNDDSDLATLLDNIQTFSTNELRFFYKLQDEINFNKEVVRTLRQEMSPGNDVKFSAVNARIQCEFDKLKPPVEITFSAEHVPVEVETFSDSIDCKNNLFERSKTNLELMIKANKENRAKPVEKITCEGKVLKYYEPGKTTATVIQGEAEVACGERAKCALPVPITKCNQCSTPEPSECTDGKKKCGKIECPRNRWLINRKEEYVGGVVCRKQSIEDGGGFNWHTINGKNKILIKKASCSKKVECHVKHPINTKCEIRSRECTKVTMIVGKARGHCPPHFDMMIKDNYGTLFSSKYQRFECNMHTGDWNVPEVNSASLIYCKYNATKHMLLLNGHLGQDDEEDPEVAYWNWWISKLIYVIIGIITFNVCMILAYKIYCCIIDRRIEKARKRRMDKDKWAKNERYKVRPENKGDTTKQFKLGYRDLKILGHKALCEALWLDFSLYSPEERVKFLEHVIIEWNKKSDIVKNTIPLLGKCLENEDPTRADRPPLHPATVQIAFSYLKIICGAFSQKFDRNAEKKIKEAIAERGRNLIFKILWDRKDGEDPDVTETRNHIIEALLYSGDEYTIALFIKMYTEKGQNISSPLRKFVWACAVKHANKFNEVRDWFEQEGDKRNAGKEEKESEEALRWGSKFDHLIYAVCAGERTQSEPQLNAIIKDPYFTKQQVMIGFHVMLEVFDDNQDTARFLFKERHKFLKKKMLPGSPEYQTLWKMIYQYIILWPRNQTWLWKHLTSDFNFTKEEKAQLNLIAVTTFGGLYGVLYKWQDVVDCVVNELMGKDYMKESELKPKSEEKSEKAPDFRDYDDSYIVSNKERYEAQMKKIFAREIVFEEKKEIRKRIRKNEKGTRTARETPLVEKTARDFSVSLKAKTAVEESGPMKEQKNIKNLERTAMEDSGPVKTQKTLSITNSKSDPVGSPVVMNQNSEPTGTGMLSKTGTGTVTGNKSKTGTGLLSKTGLTTK